MDLACLIYQIGTRSSFDFGNFVLDHLAKHAKSFAVKLPIGFPSLITGIMLKQNKNILRSTNVVEKRPGVLNFSHKLFEGKHARDLVRPSIATSDISGSKLHLRTMTEEVQRNVLKELLEEIETLKKTIETLSNRKFKCEALVRDLTAPSTATHSQPGQANDSNVSDIAEDTEDAEESEEDEGGNGSARDDVGDVGGSA